MPNTRVPIYLCNPETLEIIHRCASFSSAAHLLHVTRQAVHDAMKRGNLVRGFRVLTPKTYQIITK
jgi:hypothetical protein